MLHKNVINYSFCHNEEKSKEGGRLIICMQFMMIAEEGFCSEFNPFATLTQQFCEYQRYLEMS